MDKKVLAGLASVQVLTRQASSSFFSCIYQNYYKVSDRADRNFGCRIDYSAVHCAHAHCNVWGWSAVTSAAALLPITSDSPRYVLVTTTQDNVGPT